MVIVIIFIISYTSYWLDYNTCFINSFYGKTRQGI